MPQLLASASADKYPERRDALMKLLDVDISMLVRGNGL